MTTSLVIIAAALTVVAIAHVYLAIVARRLSREADRLRSNLHATRDDAIATAADESDHGEYVVVHEGPCADGACTCTRPEVYRIERGAA